MSSKKVQYSEAKLNQFKSKLSAELIQSEKELNKLKEDRATQKERLANTNVDFNQSSKHFQQRAENKKIISRLQLKARELKSALKRVEDKTYGVCERSGELIREERLLAKPTARFDILRK